MTQVLFEIVMKSYFQTMSIHNTEKANSSRKRTASFICHKNHNGEVVDRSWLCFSRSQTCIYCFTCRLMCVVTTKCAHFLIRKGTCDWNHALERLMSHEQSIHIYLPRLRLVADVINHYEELIQS